jgi:DNA-directed RNA polymerase beta' subunit
MAQTRTALMGTEMNLLTPNTSIPAATPANSEITLPMLVRNMTIIR